MEKYIKVLNKTLDKWLKMHYNKDRKKQGEKKGGWYQWKWKPNLLRKAYQTERGESKKVLTSHPRLKTKLIKNLSLVEIYFFEILVDNR